MVYSRSSFQRVASVVVRSIAVRRIVVMCVTWAVMVSVAQARTVDRVAAIVDDDIITLSEMRERAGARAASLFQEHPEEAVERERLKALGELLDVMIQERLLTNEVMKLKIEASDSEVDQMVADVLKSNNITMEQLEEYLTRDGQNMVGYRRQMKMQVERAKILGIQVRSRVKISDDDVRNAYMKEFASNAAERELLVRHIFFKDTGEAGKAKVAAAVARLEKGEAFDAIATEVSEDPSSKFGGELGWLKSSDMIPSFAREAFKLKKGEVSGVVETELGLHIIKLEDDRRSAARAYEEVKEELRSRLYNEALEREYKKWLAELREKSHVDIKLPGVKAVASRAE